jgi:hypothetical protein
MPETSNVADVTLGLRTMMAHTWEDYHDAQKAMREAMEAHPFWHKAAGTPLENDLPVIAATLATDMLAKVRLAHTPPAPGERLREAVDRQNLRAAAIDALAGWRYIRQVHGDLPGVGWERVENALAAALDAADKDAAGDHIADAGKLIAPTPSAQEDNAAAEGERVASAWVNSIPGVKPSDQFIALDRRAFEDCVDRVLKAEQNRVKRPWPMLDWRDTRDVCFDGTVMFGIGYDYDGWENFREEAAGYAVWPEARNFRGERKWSAYGGPDGMMWFARFDSEDAAKAAVERHVAAIAAMPTPPSVVELLETLRDVSGALEKHISSGLRVPGTRADYDDLMAPVLRARSVIARHSAGVGKP